MTATLVGAVTTPGALNPLVLQTLGLAGAQLQGNLTGALALQAQVQVGVPSLPQQLANLIHAEAVIAVGISEGLPGVTFSVSMAADLVAAARLALGNLGTLTALLGAPSMFCYEYSGGTVLSLGADIAAGLVAQPPPGLVPLSSVAGVLVGAGATAWIGVRPYFGGLG